MLSFLGRGSAFADEHNCAFFVEGSDLVLLDCPMTAFFKLKKMDLSSYERIYVLLTHTHGDHLGGTAMLIDYGWFVTKVPVTVVAPSSELKEDLKFFFEKIEGCEDRWYDLVCAEELDKPWLVEAVPTTHAPQLPGKCFGYELLVRGNKVVYTGDTNTLEPFIGRLEAGSYLYTEVSAFKTAVHLYCHDIISDIKRLTDKGVRVYLMHLDDEKVIEETLKSTGALLAPLVSETEGENRMDNSDVLNEIYDIADRLYADMCSKDTNDHALLFGYLTELGKTIVGADRASFWKWDKRNKTLWTTSATGVDKIVIPDTTGLVGKSLRLKKVVVTNDPYNDPDFNSEVDKKTGYVTKSILVLPVADINGDFIGAFQLINKDGDQGFDEKEDARKLSLAALVCGIALESETFLEESHHDKLTKLKNRMGFYYDFSKKYNKYLTGETDKPLSLFICDIDKFKRVNDTYGHNAGDDVLAFTAGLINSACGENDCAYRWGGEEFIMIMRDTDLMEAVEKAEYVRTTLMNSDIDADGTTIRCTLSFGVRRFDPSLSIEENVSAADEHLYTAKETGRNKVVY
ncbi:MAG: diguanylate cyclase [Clostridiales bacterium]|nr:diguanylate cyclase [Clostridiales bacterium]